jgi:hypothetical protein
MSQRLSNVMGEGEKRGSRTPVQPFPPMADAVDTDTLNYSLPMATSSTSTLFIDPRALSPAPSSPPLPGPSRVPPGPPMSQTPSREPWMDAMDTTSEPSPVRPRRMAELRAPTPDVLDLTVDSPPPKRPRVEVDVEELPLPGETQEPRFVRRPTPPSVPSAPEPLASFTCPVCFSPPTRATLMPCGHVCCGECLFASVKTMQRRNTYAPDAQAGATTARCVFIPAVHAISLTR